MKTEHPNAELARIAAELRALGEPELEPEHEADAPHYEPAVLTAFALAYPVTSANGPVGVAELAPLGELDRHRVWRRVLAKRGAPSRPAAPSWRATWVAVATAAGLALVPMLSPQGRETTPASRAATEALGVQARSALDSVPGEQDGARASQLAAQYSARLGQPVSGPDPAAAGPEAAR